ncbi:hypothetical protein IV417_08520 [Alphaproteobacteria bacterium KMM 3653]|uniref:Regulator RcnB of Ni and Co efflux n=1 Tax=Harenicola maris TaxID=2841044 RepID=A0AAP2CNZ9_9RHOB|nr:hypothetical protein [Harenicola maris]
MQKIIISTLIAVAVLGTSIPASAAPDGGRNEEARVLLKQKEQGKSNHSTGKTRKAEQKQAKAAQKARKSAAKEVRKRKAVGHRFKADEVKIVTNWQGRGLPRPRADQVYVIDGSDIYLAAAATLIVQSLLN